jgi:hypothetical protein
MSSARGRKPLIAPRTFDLNDLIRKTVSCFSMYVGDHATIESPPCTTLPLFRGHSDTIERATTALLGYSLRCLREQPGTISVRTGIRFFPGIKRPGTYTFLEISDTGTDVSALERRATIEDSESIMHAVMHAVIDHEGDLVIRCTTGHYITTLLLSAERNISGKRARDAQ